MGCGPQRGCGEVAPRGCANPNCLRPSLAVCSFQAPKPFGTSFRNCRIGRFAAGHLCPAAFRDERLAIPRVVEFVQLHKICGCVRRLAELDGADRCKSSNHGCVSPLICDLLNGAPERPSAPAEADDHRHDGAYGCALHQTRERFTLQDCRHFHDLHLERNAHRKAPRGRADAERTRPRASIFRVSLCQPMAPPPPLQGTEISVHRRFLGSWGKRYSPNNAEMGCQSPKRNGKSTNQTPIGCWTSFSICQKYLMGGYSITSFASYARSVLGGTWSRNDLGVRGHPF
jgi:hypothetical protein